MNHTEYDLTKGILNIKNDKIIKTDLLSPFERIIIEHNEVLVYAMV